MRGASRANPFLRLQRVIRPSGLPGGLSYHFAGPLYERPAAVGHRKNRTGAPSASERRMLSIDPPLVAFVVPFVPFPCSSPLRHPKP